jgi:hypothetical protein
VIKIPISYTDFDGKKLCEEHYFHLSKAELIDLETGSGESMSARLEKAAKSGNGGQMMRMFTEIIRLSYGQRVDGSGSQFFKDPDLTKRFMGSLAFDQLLEDLILGDTNAIDFINGLMPSGLQELAAKVGGQTTDVPLPGLLEDQPDVKNSGLSNPMDETGQKVLPWAFREPNDKELMSMTHPQMQDVYRRRSSGWKPPADAA